MVECSVCSFMNFIFRAIYNVVSTAMEYPIIVFLLSLLLAVALIFNVHAAKLICDFREVTRGGCGMSSSPCQSQSTICSLRNSVDYGVERGKVEMWTLYGVENSTVASLGPHTWSYAGDNQSPINITDKNVKNFPIRELLTWNHYDDLPSSITIENTGHTVVVKANYVGNKPTLSGADLLASYTLVQICFRWSLVQGEGSEHAINYQKFPLEVQAMHRTGPEGDCVSSHDLLMVAYFFEVSAHNPYLDPLVQNLHRIKVPGSKIKISPFPLSYLCYPFRTEFYSYGGSLTEPPCYQGAEWFIFPEPFAISDHQLHEFHQILSANGKTRITRNARPVQNINHSRIVNLNQYNPFGACSAGELSVDSMDSQDSIGLD